MCRQFKLITEEMKKDLIEIYSYRNTIHLEAEVRKGLDYDLAIGELAYRRTEGLSMELIEA